MNDYEARFTCNLSLEKPATETFVALVTTSRLHVPAILVQRDQQLKHAEAIRSNIAFCLQS